jgi:hypothetical protein
MHVTKPELINPLKFQFSLYKSGKTEYNLSLTLEGNCVIKSSEAQLF